MLPRKINQISLVFTLMLSVGGCKTPETEQSELDAEFSIKQYRISINSYSQAIKKRAASSPKGSITGREYIDTLFPMVLRKYYFNDRGEIIQSCSTDLKRIFWAFYGEHASHGRGGEPKVVNPKGIYPKLDDGSSLRHFFGAAGMESYFYLGEAAQRAHEWKTNKGPYPPDSYRDDAYAFLGAHFASTFKSWTNKGCLCRVGLMVDGRVKFSGLYPVSMPLPKTGNKITTEDGNKLRDNWLKEAKKKINRVFSSCG